MQVVVEICDVFLNVTQQVKNIDTLFKSLRWQMRRHDVDAKLLFCQNAHMLVGLPIMRVKGSHFIKDLTKVMLDLLRNGNAFLKQVYI
jgi:hypothetical protein